MKIILCQNKEEFSKLQLTEINASDLVAYVTKKGNIKIKKSRLTECNIKMSKKEFKVLLTQYANYCLQDEGEISY